jgi:hypothetical protein
MDKNEYPKYGLPGVDDVRQRSLDVVLLRERGHGVTHRREEHRPHIHLRTMPEYRRHLKTAFLCFRNAEKSTVRTSICKQCQSTDDSQKQLSYASALQRRSPSAHPSATWTN